MARICVFCGSRSGDLPEFTEAAEKLGACFAVHGHTLVYGGGSTGIMGTLANSALEHGGEVIGVIPVHLARPELMHDKVTDMRITADMHGRKSLMHSLADAYLALPGGYGTLEELFETVTWAQLDLHTRPIVLLNLCGLFDGLVTMLDQMLEHRFLSPECRRHLTVFSAVDEVVNWAKAIASP